MRLGEGDPGEVVAFGTGNSCVTRERLTLDGRTVFDCQAEVIARRALLK